MAITIKDYLNKAKFVRDNILDEQERIVLKNEKLIDNINKNQFTDGYGSDNKELHNINPVFTGFYKSGDKKGQRYDFFNTGKFIRGLYVTFLSKEKIEISSTELEQTQSERKYKFLTGYTNIFGLDKANQDKLNNEIILPELQNFIKKYL